MPGYIYGNTDFAQKCALLNPFDNLFDSLGEPLYDSNSERLKAIKT